MMTSSTLSPDRAEIRRALDVLHARDAVIELRALHKARKRTDAGYFDHEHRDELIEAAAKLNERGVAVYVCMNDLDRQLLARHANRLQEFAQTTATDANVTHRRWLLIDLDPQRPKDTSATDGQLEAAKTRARKVYGYLAERGWPAPVAAESGNGMHLLYRLDLPNDEASRDLVKRCLEALAAKFDDETVKIDKSVFNAARIIKLHGTAATKGDNVPSAPWRLSRLSSVPESIGTVSLEQLQALAGEAGPAKPAKLNGHSAGSGAWAETDVSAFLARGGIETLGEPAPHDGVVRWRLKRCPFNPEHGATESAVFLAADGRLGFKCQHNSCADRHWSDLRELVDGPRPARNSSATRANGRPSAVQDGQHTEPEAETTVMTLSTIQSQPLRPLWPGKLWRGKLSLMAGDPGLGKSLATLDIAARITRGSAWPASEARAPLGDVVLLSAEDDAADTLVPRLAAAGADLARVHAIIEVSEIDPRTGKRRRKSFRIGAHLEQLERVFIQFKPALLIIDPITAYMSADTDSHATADVRADLAPLAELAQRHGVAVLMVSHLNKATTMQALYRVTGSVAFVAAARSAFGVVRDPNDPTKERRFFLPLKSNLGKDRGGLAYRVVELGEGRPRVEWEPDAVDVDIDELAAQAAPSPRERAKRVATDKASLWLQDQLKGGAVAAADMYRRAEAAGISTRDLKRARRNLGVMTEPAGYAGSWHWCLPPESYTKTPAPRMRTNLSDTESLGRDSQSRARVQVLDTESFGRESQSRTEMGAFCEPAQVHDSVSDTCGEEMGV